MEEQKSNDFKVEEVQEALEHMTDLDEIKAFTADDTRKGVVAAAANRMAVLSGKDAVTENKVDPRWDPITRRIMANKYHTIKLPRGENEPPYQSVNVSGTRTGGEPFEMRMRVQRGVSVPNVPREAVLVLHEQIETKIKQEKKTDARGGNRNIVVKANRFDLLIEESYDTPKPPAK